MCQSIIKNMKTMMCCQCISALTVADYIREKTDLNPGLIKSSGRGDYVPVADNSTPEGRAINRRVEVKIYNSYNSPAQGE